MVTNSKIELVTNNITTLSSKLGVKPDELYKAMIKKAKTDWIYPGIESICAFICLIVLWHFAGDFFTNFLFPGERERGLDHTETQIAIFVCISVLILVCGIWFIADFFDSLRKFVEGKVNPEGTALEHLLNDH